MSASGKDLNFETYKKIETMLEEMKKRFDDEIYDKIPNLGFGGPLPIKKHAVDYIRTHSDELMKEKKDDTDKVKKARIYIETTSKKHDAVSGILNKLSGLTNYEQKLTYIEKIVDPAIPGMEPEVKGIRENLLAKRESRGIFGIFSKNVQGTLAEINTMIKSSRDTQLAEKQKIEAEIVKDEKRIDRAIAQSIEGCNTLQNQFGAREKAIKNSTIDTSIREEEFRLVTIQDRIVEEISAVLRNAKDAKDESSKINLCMFAHALMISQASSLIPVDLAGELKLKAVQSEVPPIRIQDFLKKEPDKNKFPEIEGSSSGLVDGIAKSLSFVDNLLQFAAKQASESVEDYAKTLKVQRKEDVDGFKTDFSVVCFRIELARDSMKLPPKAEPPAAPPKM